MERLRQSHFFGIRRIGAGIGGDRPVVDRSFLVRLSVDPRRTPVVNQGRHAQLRGIGPIGLLGGNRRLVRRPVGRGFRVRGNVARLLGSLDLGGRGRVRLLGCDGFFFRGLFGIRFRFVAGRLTGLAHGWLGLGGIGRFGLFEDNRLFFRCLRAGLRRVGGHRIAVVLGQIRWFFGGRKWLGHGLGSCKSNTFGFLGSELLPELLETRRGRLAADTLLSLDAQREKEASNDNQHHDQCCESAEEHLGNVASPGVGHKRDQTEDREKHHPSRTREHE